MGYKERTANFESQLSHLLIVLPARMCASVTLSVGWDSNSAELIWMSLASHEML